MRLCRWPIAAVGLAVALLATGAIEAAHQQAKSPASPAPSFRDVAVQAGLDFIHGYRPKENEKLGALM